MSSSVVVVLVVGLVLFASLFARKRGYSNNQRIVLSGIAIGLLIWNLLSGDGAAAMGEPGKAIIVGLGVVVLIAAVRYLGRKQ